MNYGTKLTVDDKIRSLFQLDPVLPAQYEDTFQRRFPLVPEKTLMLAVLEDAVTCLQRYAGARDGKSKQMFRDAENWFLAKENDWLFSFEGICSTFGWDPTYIRRGLLKGVERLLAPAPKGDAESADKPAKKKCKGRKVPLAA